MQDAFGAFDIIFAIAIVIALFTQLIIVERIETLSLCLMGTIDVL